MSAEELIEQLAAMLRRREPDRKRDEMPALGLITEDGTELVVTLAAHHRDGCVV